MDMSKIRAKVWKEVKAMKLCYRCFLKKGGRSETWDMIPCDSSKKMRCETCDLYGSFVREVKSNYLPGEDRPVVGG